MRRAGVACVLPALVSGCSFSPWPFDTAVPAGDSAVGTGDSAGLHTGDTGAGQVAALAFDGPAPRNLLFVSIDTLRRDHVGAHGGPGLTPFLDSLLPSALVLDDHVQCANWTFASTTCTLAGRSNIDRGHIPRLGLAMTPVPPGTPFLAGWLGDAGFYSIIASANTWLSQAAGNTQGYDEEFVAADDAEDVHRVGQQALLDAIGRGDVGDRWFLHLHVTEPHAPYAAYEKFRVGLPQLAPWPEDLSDHGVHYGWRALYDSLSPDEQALLEAHLRLLYAAEVRMLDHRLGLVWEGLRSAGLLDDTLVVIWTDHGEAFWEHGDQTHAYRLYGEENDGFLLFWSAGIVAGRVTEPTHTVDLVPTLLDLYGIARPAEVTGHVIGTAPAARPRFGEAVARAGTLQSVMRDGLKLHYAWGSGEVTFHDRNLDVDEAQDLYDPSDVDPRALALWTVLRPEIEAMDLLIEHSPTWPPELP